MSILEQVRKHRIVAAMRGVPWEKAGLTAEALYQGGIRMVEVTFDQKNRQRLTETAAAIREIKQKMRDSMAVGAGTVLTPEEVRAAKNAGAAFILAPNVDEDVIRCAKELGMGVIPGAFTPTEVAGAYRLGADLVKLFPADNFGIGYIKALKAPLGHIPLLAMGGVKRDNLQDFLSVADGVGIGASIVNLSLIREERFDELAQLASSYTSLL